MADFSQVISLGQKCCFGIFPYGLQRDMTGPQEFVPKVYPTFYESVPVLVSFLNGHYLLVIVLSLATRPLI